MGFNSGFKGLTLALDEVDGQRLIPAALPLERNRVRTHCTGGWVGRTSGLDRCRFHPWTIQPKASCCSDFAVPSHDEWIAI